MAEEMTVKKMGRREITAMMLEKEDSQPAGGPTRRSKAWLSRNPRKE
jgi:hypothetical protein